MTNGKGKSRRRPLGRRRRRLRLAVTLLLVVAILAVVAGMLLWRANRAEVRRPGEALEDVTDRLSRDLPAGAPAPALKDVTAAAGLGDFVTFAGPRSSQLPEDMGSGVAWGDVDGDGDDDLFAVAAGGSLTAPPSEWARSRLYENRGDGTFREVESFPETRILGMGAAWGDADGDGLPELAVTGYRTLRLYRNLGGGELVLDDRLPAPDGFWSGVSWVDFDADGDLDLSVCGYVRYGLDHDPHPASEQYGAKVPYTLNPASFEPERNLLFENRGDGTFEEVALLYGVSNPEGRSLGALWHDFDDDGRIDLYVANDISDNALFLNRGETFDDVALSAWVADYRGAMGLAAGDWNRDGDDDLFITHWVAQENALYDSRLRVGPLPPPEAGLLTGGDGDGRAPNLTFSDLSAPLGLGQIALPLVGWGTEFADLDGDGWLDLVVSNGSTLEEGDGADGDGAPRRLRPQLPLLLWNEGGEAFHDLAPGVPALAEPRVGRGMAVSDYDRDGDLDLLFVHHDGGLQLLRNDMQDGHWLQLRLRRRLAGGGWGDGEGAAVVAWIGAVPLRRAVTGASYLSQSTRTLHFGLGDATGVDAVEVRWPGGAVERFGPLTGDAAWEIREGEGQPRRLDGGERSAAGDGGEPELSREETVAFWQAQRAAMDAMKRQGDVERAIELFRRALAIDPGHEDSRYYLANCLWATGERDEALDQLAELRRRSPQSHRAHRQWASLAVQGAASRQEIAAAQEAVDRALEINREETGALLLHAEIDLVRGRLDAAEESLALATRTNHRAVGGFFLRAYVARERGDAAAATELLERAQEARGAEWKPEGTVAEGDVSVRMHRDETPLSSAWRGWDGTPDPAVAFDRLEELLAAYRALPAEAPQTG